MNNDPVEVLVEIRYERALSIGVVPADSLNALYPGDERLVWLPRAEIAETRAERNGRSTLTVPRWLAEAERLISEIAEDPNQGSFL